jgi:hypothetical protein
MSGRPGRPTNQLPCVLFVGTDLGVAVTVHSIAFALTAIVPSPHVTVTAGASSEAGGPASFKREVVD